MFYPIFPFFIPGKSRGLCAEFPTNRNRKEDWEAPGSLLLVINHGLEPRLSSRPHCQRGVPSLLVVDQQGGWWVYPGWYTGTYTGVVYTHHAIPRVYIGYPSCYTQGVHRVPPTIPRKGVHRVHPTIPRGVHRAPSHTQRCT